MTMTLLQGMTLLEGGAAHDGLKHLPIPAWGFGLIALALLIAGLMFVLNIGKSRPHA
ncbi:hypothetical protein [Mariniluteicoccus flavus]